MTAPIQLDGPYRRQTLRRRMRRAAAQSPVAAWLRAWLGIAFLLLVLALLVAGVPFIAGVLSAYLPTY